MKWLILLPLILMALSCSKATHISPDPIYGMKFFQIKAGTTVGDSVTTHDGWFIETNMLKGLVEDALKPKQKDILTID